VTKSWQWKRRVSATVGKIATALRLHKIAMRESHRRLPAIAARGVAVFGLLSRFSKET
jgi:hypothetical protein